MVSLKQIKTLQDRVNKALSFIDLLKEENKTLKATLDKSQEKIQEFEKLITDFKNDQTEIEQTILDVIQKLDTLEDEIPGIDSSSDDSPHQESHESHEPISGDEAAEEGYEGSTKISIGDQGSEGDQSSIEDDEPASTEESERDLDIF